MSYFNKKEEDKLVDPPKVSPIVVQGGFKTEDRAFLVEMLNKIDEAVNFLCEEVVEVHELVKEDKWISVKDEEPDIETNRILVYSVSGNIHVLHRYLYTLNRYHSEWVLSENDEDFPGEKVEFTHWQHIPFPPKLSRP